MTRRFTLGPPFRSSPSLPRSRGGSSAAIAVLACLGPIIAGCSTAMAPAPTPQIVIATDQLVGKWGLAAYRVDTDLDRTKGEARRACSNPYLIGPGPTGGVLMHLADQSVPEELVLKTGGDGSVYVGPKGKPGDPRDRQIMSYADGVIVMRWVDPSVATRYGTMVYVRCAVA